MIVDKKKDRAAEDEQPDVTPEVPVEPEKPGYTPPSMDTYEEAVEVNPIFEAYRAVRTIISEIKVNPDDPNSESYFKSIKMDNGQLARIKGSKLNEEYGIAFPAVFIHFIDVRYLVGSAKIAEGKGVMRIHYVLNHLNNSDDDVEGEGLFMFKRIVNAIEKNKNRFSPLLNRFQLKYWDQPLSFDDGLQPYWIDYEIWFNDYTMYRYKDYVPVYITHPPFTQPSDQNEIANPDHLPNWTEPKFEEIAGFDEDF